MDPPSSNGPPWAGPPVPPGGAPGGGRGGNMEDNDDAASVVSVSSTTSAASSSKPPSARRPMSELSKEELLSKCKGLLQIAQKAKAAKDGEEEIPDANLLECPLSVPVLAIVQVFLFWRT